MSRHPFDASKESAVPRRWFTACVAFALIGAGPACRAEADVNVPGFWAGTAKVDITPREDVAVDILGRSLKLRDRLQARVLVLKDESTSVAIVAADLIVFASPKVIAEANAKHGVKHVILSATHTHASMMPRGLVIKPPLAPDWTRSGKSPTETVDWPGLSADPWYAETEAKIVAAIGQAMQNLFAARIVAGQGPFESAYMAHNRRLVRDGRVSALWENPDRRPTQPIDPTVGVVRVDDTTGKPRALAVHYACHAVALMGVGVISRDFPGALVDHLEQQLGPDCLTMFLQGAEGDIDPYDLHNLRGENRFNISRQSGISLAKGALRIAADLKPRPDADRRAIRVKEQVLTIPNRHGGKTTDVGLLTVVIQRDFAFVAIPGEPFIRHQLDLRAQSPIDKVFLLGLAYCGQGAPFVVYIPTAQAVKEGGYGASECSFLAPDAGEKLVGEAVAAIRELLGTGKTASALVPSSPSRTAKSTLPLSD